MKSEKKYQKGISLFIAVLVASVTALFSFAISNIALREVILAQTGRDSQSAFYAANSGVECALFWDLKMGAFNVGSSEITCNEQTGSANMQVIFQGGEEIWTLMGSSNLTFNLSDDEGNTSCFIIDDVKKTIERDGENNITSIEVLMEVRGYNTCDFASPRILERAIRVKY